jgi:hypothetical protein
MPIMGIDLADALYRVIRPLAPRRALTRCRLLGRSAPIQGVRERLALPLALLFLTDLARV